MLFFEAIIDGSRPEGHRYTYRETNITPNEWITAKPWAIQQDVFIQDFDNKVEFGWVDSSTSKREDGSIEISGLEGGIGRRAIKCWMKIPMPYEDMEGWNFEYLQDFEHIPKKNHQYLVCVEIQVSNYTKRYELRLAWYNPTRTGDWDGYKAADTTHHIIAWRDIPKPTQKKNIPQY